MDNQSHPESRYQIGLLELKIFFKVLFVFILQLYTVQAVTFENLKCNFEIFVKTKTIRIFIKKKMEN